MTRDEYTERAHEFAPRGSSLPWAKLDEARVKAAREEHERARFAIAYIQQNYSVAALARKYGVSKGAMEKALNYTTWIHV